MLSKQDTSSFAKGLMLGERKEHQCFSVNMKNLQFLLKQLR